LGQIQIPVPPYQKQLLFDDLYKQIDEVKRLHSASSAELDALMPSILDKAFMGEL
jgi:type I restriction enzyme, S subunit